MNNTNVVYLRKTKQQFLWTSNEAKALGMIFCANKDNIFKLNLEAKIKQFEIVLKQWQHRKLTLLGKITVI